MRKDGIPYVPNTPNYYPPVDYKKMDLKELIAKYIKTCAVANGQISVCSKKCSSPCEYGKRAIQLLSNEVYNDPPIPLYGGKTMIEAAKAENDRRRKEAEEQKVKEELKKVEEKVAIKRRKNLPKNWWEESLKYGNQIEYLMKTFDMSKTRAKSSIYNYRSRHGLTEPKTGPVIKTEPVKSETAEEPMIDTTKKDTSNDILLSTMETKMDELMKLQSEYEANIKKYTKLYNEVKEKIDTLCKAMDIFG